jgi:hypothetical protein
MIGPLAPPARLPAVLHSAQAGSPANLELANYPARRAADDPFPWPESAGTSELSSMTFFDIVIQRPPTPNAWINIIYTNTLLHLPRWWDNLNPMIASKGHASVTRALPSAVASVFSSGQVPKLRPIIIPVVVTSPA